jgi:hypothetical protein
MALEHTLDSDKSSEPAVTVFRPSQYLGEACCRGSVLADNFFVIKPQELFLQHWSIPLRS